MVCLKKVEGFDGKCNDVVFCGEDAMQHLIFFPGDVQVSRPYLDFTYSNIKLTCAVFKPVNCSKFISV